MTRFRVIKSGVNSTLRLVFLPQIAPSILSADFSRLAAHAKQAIEGGATLLHVDVMDGHFVPNITIGPPVVASLRKAIDIPLDCHLMIENPDRYIPAFLDAGADWISVHEEACVHLHRVLEMIDYVLVISVNPGFRGQKFIPASLEKIKKLVAIRQALNLDFDIEIDGGVSLETLPQIVRAGAEVLVAGSAVFGSGDAKLNTQRLLQAANQAAMAKA